MGPNAYRHLVGGARVFGYVPPVCDHPRAARRRVAAIVEIVRAAIAHEDYEGFVVLLILQFANAIIGFYEEAKAGDAIAALKKQLAPQCHVCREGLWQSIPAKNLVPGDLLELKLGDVIPADSILLDGIPLEVSQGLLPLARSRRKRARKRLLCLWCRWTSRP